MSRRARRLDADPAGSFRSGRPAPKRHSRRARLRYRFDAMFASGTAPLIVWLAVITLGMVVLAGTAIALLHATVSGTGDRSFREAVWASLLRTLDPGTMGADTGWEFRAVSLLVTIGGIFVVSTLIGLIASGIDRKLHALRQGRAPVIEHGHTLILGWSPKLLALVEELVIANQNQRDACVVILAPRDKTAMEHELRARLGRTRPTRIVCRTGDPADPVDIQIANPLAAKSIVVLVPSGESGDASVVRTVLSLMSHGLDFVRPPVVAELRSTASARSLRQILDRKLVTVVSDEIIGRIAAQVARQHGLSSVYQELLDFAGDEMYIADAAVLVGASFGDALLACEASSVIGLQRASGEVVVAPPVGMVLTPGDRIIGISRDDDTLVVDRAVEPGTAPEERKAVHSLSTYERVLMVGWSSLGPLILRELDRCADGRLSVHVVQPAPHATPDCDPAAFPNLDLLVETVALGDGSCFRAILGRDVPEHVLLLCVRDGATPAQADADVLLRLLQVQHAIAEVCRDGRRPGIVVELLEPRDVELAQVTRADDFILSERLTSLVLAQLSENAVLDTVLRDLLDVGGTEIVIRPIRDYGLAPGEYQYAELVRTGIEHDEVVVGLQQHTRSVDGEATRAISLNPAKSARAAMAADDQLVVISRHPRRQPPAPAATPERSVAR